MQNENRSEYRNHRDQAEAPDRDLGPPWLPEAVRTLSPAWPDRAAQLHVDDGSVGGCRLGKGSSAVVVILAPGKVLRVRRPEGKHPEALDNVRNGPRPANRNRTWATAATASRTGATTHEAGSDIAEEQQAAHADAGAPEGEQRVEDPVRQPGPERERGRAAAARRPRGGATSRPSGPWRRGYGSGQSGPGSVPMQPACGRLRAWHGAGLVLPVPDRTERADPRIAWVSTHGRRERPGRSAGPMTLAQASYLRFLCDEFEETFDASLTDGQSAIVVASFLDEPMTDAQARTLFFLSRGRRHGGSDRPHIRPGRDRRSEAWSLSAASSPPEPGEPSRRNATGRGASCDDAGRGHGDPARPR